MLSQDERRAPGCAALLRVGIGEECTLLRDTVNVRRFAKSQAAAYGSLPTHGTVFVSIAKMKEHATAGVTLSMKNCFGITPATIYSDEAPQDEPAGAALPIGHLRDLGWVTQSQAKGRGRAILLEITGKGRDGYLKAAGVVEQVDKAMTSGLTPAERGAALAALKVVTDTAGPR